MGDERILKEEIDKVLDLLSEDKRKVLRVRFGLDDGVIKSYEDVATELRMTPDEVKETEAEALRLLRHSGRL